MYCWRVKSKLKYHIALNWQFSFSAVPRRRILPILQECPCSCVVSMKRTFFQGPTNRLTRLFKMVVSSPVTNCCLIEKSALKCGRGLHCLQLGSSWGPSSYSGLSETIVPKLQHSVLQLQYVAVCYGVLQCVTSCYNVLQCATVCYSVLQQQVATPAWAKQLFQCHISSRPPLLCSIIQNMHSTKTHCGCPIKKVLWVTFAWILFQWKQKFQE